MTRTSCILLVSLSLAACGGASTQTAEPEHAGGHHGEGAAPEPSRVLEDGSRLFGSEMSEEREVVPLGTILASPAEYEGQVVKTEGEIAQVCQQMGCWMELRVDENSPGIRVPMAGHSFYLPRDLAGQPRDHRGHRPRRGALARGARAPRERGRDGDGAGRQHRGDVRARSSLRPATAA
ncbi:MAG: DUF4920 domain-containing protein [Sandaracinaceae bacterium]|nr:DUF4920 domain-containing protein [Sandaracinaceae bacterium]